LVVTAAVVTLAYTILLPFDITQRFSLPTGTTSTHP